MTRFLAVLVIMVIIYVLIRNVVRGFLRGLNLGNENVRRKNEARPTDRYKDVQDAEFKDITDEE